MAAIKIIAWTDGPSQRGIASNSLAVSNGDLLGYTSGFVVKATASTGRVIGMSNGTKTYDSDNQTVDKATVSFLPFEPRETIVELTADDTLAIGDVGKYYLLTSSQTIDQSTGRTFQVSTDTTDTAAAADPATIYPFQLVEFISTTKGRFMVV